MVSFSSNMEQSGWYPEDALLPISGLRHMAVCERQFALVHIEQVWADNIYTAEGSVLHRNVDAPHYETRRGRRLVHALPLACRRLGLSGRADLVEFPAKMDGGSPIPIEFKRGHPKPDDVDEVQVCAQALCLEEMLGIPISHGYLYYHQERRRHEVEIGEGLRSRAETLAKRMHALFDAGKTPVVDRMPKCRVCSLEPVCKPEWSGRGVSTWERWHKLLKESGRS
ncbi:MAG: CRISPR-associated protein Cas4 [Bryobacterales bacterium]|nr:CRISPR-associated protein Cas4 [Bryobacterales bacterium]